jgi:hypothetical protein
VNSFGRTYAAPPVHYPVGRSFWLAAVLALCALAGAVVLLAWALFGAGTQRAWVIAAGGLWLVCSLSAGWFWRTAPCGTLVWNGAHWLLESSHGAAARAPCTQLQVSLDLQGCLWLRLPPESADAGTVLWLWLEQRSLPVRWDDLRRAVYSPARSGGLNADPNVGPIVQPSDGAA